jgi:hypothetical protein
MVSSQAKRVTVQGFDGHLQRNHGIERFQVQHPTWDSICFVLGIKNLNVVRPQASWQTCRLRMCNL